MSDDIVETLLEQATNLQRFGWSATPFDTAAEEIMRLRDELESMCFNHEQAMMEAKRLRDELEAVKDERDNASYKFTPAAIPPPKAGSYIVLELIVGSSELFNRGRYIPGADEISGGYWNGSRWVAIFNGTEYEYKHVSHWTPLPEPPEERGQ